MMKKLSFKISVVGTVAIILLLIGCVKSASNDGVTTLSSIEKMDDYPLYTMHYYGDYEQLSPISPHGEMSVDNDTDSTPFILMSHAWACSLFAALGDPRNMIYGRNFDWEFSPAILLFTQPPNAYASVSMVDIAYLGFDGSKAGTLLDTPLQERQSLLYAPFIPFDGMNDQGLVIGMAAVPSGQVQPDPTKQTIDSLRVIREILDHTRTVDEAVTILQNYNIDYADGPPLHYLIADQLGDAALVEYYQGKIEVIANENPWHLATNFLRSSVNGDAAGQCWRYDKINEWLTQADGKLTMEEATSLLAEVSQYSTQWSIVYGFGSGDIWVTMGRQYYLPPHTFHFNLVVH